MPVVAIPTNRITDWQSFHDVFAETLGFPGYYGRNMDAWIDCLTYPDVASGGTRFAVPEGDTLTLDLGLIAGFRGRCPDQYQAIVECSAFVNKRRIEAGDPPILIIAFM